MILRFFRWLREREQESLREIDESLELPPPDPPKEESEPEPEPEPKGERGVTSFRNDGLGSLALVIEPWIECYVIPKGQTAEVEVYCVSGPPTFSQVMGMAEGYGGIIELWVGVGDCPLPPVDSTIRVRIEGERVEPEMGTINGEPIPSSGHFYELFGGEKQP